MPSTVETYRILEPRRDPGRRDEQAGTQRTPGTRLQPSGR